MFGSSMNHNYTLQQKLRGLFFRKHLGFGPELNRVNSDICVFSFEPNPDHYSRHEHLRRAYNSLNWRYTPIHAGVGHLTGNIHFTTLEMTLVSRQRKVIAEENADQSKYPSFVLLIGSDVK